MNYDIVQRYQDEKSKQEKILLNLNELKNDNKLSTNDFLKFISRDYLLSFIDFKTSDRFFSENKFEEYLKTNLDEKASNYYNEEQGFWKNSFQGITHYGNLFKELHDYHFKNEYIKHIEWYNITKSRNGYFNTRPSIDLRIFDMLLDGRIVEDVFIELTLNTQTRSIRL